MDAFRGGFGFLRRGRHPVIDPKYVIETTPHGLILKLNGSQLITSSILDRDYFVKDWFTAPELEVIARWDESVQRVMKEKGTRIYSGLPYYLHVDRVVQNLFEAGKAVNVPLDYKILIEGIGHDRIEDDKRIGALEERWEKALNENDYKKRLIFEEQLKVERAKVKGEVEGELLQYDSDTGVKGQEREKLERDTRIAVNQIKNVTRFSNERVYASSMGYQFQRIGREPLEQMLGRFPVKNSDRNENQIEYGLMLPLKRMQQLEIAFKDASVIENYVVGEELRKRFNGVSLEAKGMPLAIRVQTAFKSVFPSHYQNETIDRYEQGILAGRYGDRTTGLLKLSRFTEASMIKSAVELLMSAVKSYEFDKDIANRKEEVDKEIKDLKGEGSYYYKVMAGGPIEYWLLRDPRGRKFIQALDKDPEEKFNVYRSARHFIELMPMFGMFYEHKDESETPVLLSDPVIYDPRKHKYFALKNLDEMMKVLPNVPLLKKSPAGKMGSGHGGLMLF